MEHVPSILQCSVHQSVECSKADARAPISLSLSLSPPRVPTYPRGRSEIQCATGRGRVAEIHMQGATDFPRKAW